MALARKRRRNNRLMKIPWPEKRCIVCLNAPQVGVELSQMTDSHVIPKSVGGRLSAEFLCKGCNDRMGELEATLQKDASVRRFVDQLENDLPRDLVQMIRCGERYFADTEHYGRVEATMGERAELRPRQSIAVRSDENTRKQIEADLRRRGSTSEEIAAVQVAFEAAKPGEWIEIRSGFRIQKRIDWSSLSLQPSLTDPITPLEVPVGIAYLFMAACVGTEIYGGVFDPVRKALQAALVGDAASAAAYCKNRHGTEKRIAKPQHLLRARAGTRETTVVFQVFGDLAWPVEFPGVAHLGKQTLYLLDLANDQECWATKIA
jgi:hypothetical protein